MLLTPWTHSDYAKVERCLFLKVAFSQISVSGELENAEQRLKPCHGSKIKPGKKRSWLLISFNNI